MLTAFTGQVFSQAGSGLKTTPCLHSVGLSQSTRQYPAMPAAGWRGTHTPLFAQVVASKDAHAKDKQTDTEISSGKPFNVHTETEGQKGNKQESSLL